MPSTSDAKKATAKKGAEFGATLAKRRSQDFKSKIEGWNDTAPVDEPASPIKESHAKSDLNISTKNPPQAAARDVVTAPALKALVVEVSPDDVGATRLPTRQIDLQKKAWVRRKSRPQIELADELKEAVSPKKRIVSDDHWRKDPAAKVATALQSYILASAKTTLPAIQAPKSAPSTPIKRWSDTTPAQGRTVSQLSSPGKLPTKSSPRDVPKFSDGLKTAGSSPVVDKRQSTLTDFRSHARGYSTPTTPTRTSKSIADLTATLTASLSGTYNPPSSLLHSRNRQTSASDNENSRRQEQRTRSAKYDTSQSPPLRRPRTAERAQEVQRPAIPSTFTPATDRRIEGWLSNTSNLESKRPSTSSGAIDRSRLSSQAPNSLLSRASDDHEVRRQALRRRKTAKHSDLLSVLSHARTAEDGPIRSARSIRARRSIRTANNINAVMNGITSDELKYQRELRTLVDGVIPVLLTHVLKKHDADRKDLKKQSEDVSEQALTRPIVEMGVALERIRSLHRRIPLHNDSELVTWASGALNAYVEYVRAWRLGFGELVVHLAAADEPSSSELNASSMGMSSINSRVSGEKREKADVAFLLKRPFVRLKHLTEALETINKIQPAASTDRVWKSFTELLKAAKQKASDERARLEDEAAAGIDTSRARDLRNLAPLAGVRIDGSRNVKARDLFDLELVHSSGQQIVCKIEMICRNDAQGRGTSGDVLICEMGLQGRWLFFPPISHNFISARDGDKDGEMIVMIRGISTARGEWRETFLLRAEDPDTVDDWLDLLGSSPLPTRLSRKSSFSKPARVQGRPRVPTTVSESLLSSQLSSSDREDLPIGERVRSGARKWDESERSTQLPATDDYEKPLRRTKAVRHRSNSSQVSVDSYEEVHVQVNSRRYDNPRNHQSQGRKHKSNQYADDESYISGDSQSDVSSSKKSYSVWLPSQSGVSNGSSYDYIGDEDDYDKDRTGRARHEPDRPQGSRKLSSAPSTDLPKLAKARASVPTSSQQRSQNESRTVDKYPVGRGNGVPSQNVNKSMSQSANSVASTGQNNSALQSTRVASTPQYGNTPSLGSSIIRKHRRTSSPLKHEYRPSSESDSLSESDIETGDDYDVDLDDDIESITSESSAETIEEGVSTIGDLKGFQQYARRPVPSKSVSPPLLSPIEEPSLGPSDSASQGPYRSVPVTGEQPLDTYATLFSWSESGTWTSLHPEECTIFVSPGLVEAFDVNQARAVRNGQAKHQQSPSQQGVRPLVALELTPLVPLRRGTALDITVRSPPTNNSLLRFGNNIMLRSRSPEECDSLYSLLNRARIDNPTYIALQRARGPIKTSNWGEIMDKQNAARTASASSWWPTSLSRKSSTYRSRKSQGHSTIATESSIATLDSAFSALRRFSSTKSKFFNIGKSTMSFREGSRSMTSDSLSSGPTNAPLTFDARLGTPMGVSNTKIRLYVRETSSRWRDLGSAKMTVMLPPRDDPALINNPRATGNEKRIIVYGQSKGEVLLHAVLPETSFERVARTGIAVSVWQETETPAAVGGVGSATLRVYMVQMKTEREAAFTFGLVGKLRY